MKGSKAEAIGIIGMGRMGGCLVRGLLEAGRFEKSQIFFTTKHDETASKAVSELKVQRAASNRALVEQCQTVVIAVKPQNIGEVLSEIGGVVTSEHSIVSIVASIPTEEIEKLLGKKPAVLRAMPNTPAFVRAGITAMCKGSRAGDRDWERGRCF